MFQLNSNPKLQVSVPLYRSGGPGAIWGSDPSPHLQNQLKVITVVTLASGLSLQAASNMYLSYLIITLYKSTVTFSLFLETLLYEGSYFDCDATNDRLSCVKHRRDTARSIVLYRNWTERASATLNHFGQVGHQPQLRELGGSSYMRDQRLERPHPLSGSQSMLSPDSKDPGNRHHRAITFIHGP